MEVGKISESVLKRSVLRKIKSRNKMVINGADVGADCAVFTCREGAFAQSVQGAALFKPAEIRFLIHRAVSGIAVSSAKPAGILLSLFLPEGLPESDLKELMEMADRTAEELGLEIAGGHTQVFAGLPGIYASVTAAGDGPVKLQEIKSLKPGWDIVASKWVGLEGTAMLVERYGEDLAGRYPLHMLKTAGAFDRYLSIVKDSAAAIESGAGALHDVSGGGIYAALWELAERADVGLEIDLKRIPIRQETVEVCEFFGVSPYELYSGGTLLAVAEDGGALVRRLQTLQLPAAVIGRITDNNDRVVINEEEKRFLERPKGDELTKIERRYGK